MDTAIIGAGVSGLYSAFRLTTSNGSDATLPGSQVQMFDLSHRIGGRLESVRLPGMKIVGELGGMRYLSSHRIVNTLVEEVFKRSVIISSVPLGMSVAFILFMFISSFASLASYKVTQMMESADAEKYPVQKFFRPVEGGVDTVIVFPN